jgi:hypothetical protein
VTCKSLNIFPAGHHTLENTTASSAQRSILTIYYRWHQTYWKKSSKPSNRTKYGYLTPLIAGQNRGKTISTRIFHKFLSMNPYHIVHYSPSKSFTGSNQASFGCNLTTSPTIMSVGGTKLAFAVRAGKVANEPATIC